MKIGIMQPYFFPYIGYFQLMNYVDKFVIYDNIEFTKKGWINRNRLLVNGKDAYFSLPLKKDSDYLNVRDRFLSEIWKEEKVKTLNRIKESYRKAPNFAEAFPIVERCFSFEKENLFEFIFHSIKVLNEYLGIMTEILISSEVDIDHKLRSEDKVIALCKALKADEYINSIGGLSLYSPKNFSAQGIKLSFMKVTEIIYPQFSHEFVPFLSILDVIMFNTREQTLSFLKNNFTLMDGHHEI